MKLFTEKQTEQLLKNGHDLETDHKPVVKLVCEGSTWLVTEIDPHNTDKIFGLRDRALAEPELVYESIRELEARKGPMGLRVERDMYFKADSPLRGYWEELSTNMYPNLF